MPPAAAAAAVAARCRWRLPLAVSHWRRCHGGGGGGGTLPPSVADDLQLRRRPPTAGAAAVPGDFNAAGCDCGGARASTGGRRGRRRRAPPSVRGQLFNACEGGFYICASLKGWCETCDCSGDLTRRRPRTARLRARALTLAPSAARRRRRRAPPSSARPARSACEGDCETCESLGVVRHLRVPGRLQPDGDRTARRVPGCSAPLKEAPPAGPARAYPFDGRPPAAFGRCDTGDRMTTTRRDGRTLLPVDGRSVGAVQGSRRTRSERG